MQKGSSGGCHDLNGSIASGIGGRERGVTARKLVGQAGQAIVFRGPWAASLEPRGGRPRFRLLGLSLGQQKPSQGAEIIQNPPAGGDMQAELSQIVSYKLERFLATLSAFLNRERDLVLDIAASLFQRVGEKSHVLVGTLYAIEWRFAFAHRTRFLHRAIVRAPGRSCIPPIFAQKIHSGSTKFSNVMTHTGEQWCCARLSGIAQDGEIPQSQCVACALRSISKKGDSQRRSGRIGSDSEAHRQWKRGAPGLPAELRTR